ncbi:MAG: hypothetical protein QM809_02675 [Gordonia sp. (in: high G+C Gram-positive bacteria)]|uniref:hypothetical protein n=1 Tax=Gordonia sp. (in: high G+C Gram-positive bacteria) TaxID=84139 RepID=UPI0039E420A9
MTAPDSHRPPWFDDFTIPADAAGVVLAFDIDDEGAWAARIDESMGVDESVAEPRITPAVLDLRTTCHLRDNGDVPEADDPAVFDELLDLCRRARRTLIDRDSVLMMGTSGLRLVTVSLDAVMAATVPEVNRVHGMIVELAGDEPVAAVFLGPGTDAWPGLWEALTARGYTMMLPGDEFPETFAGDERETDTLDPVEAPPSLAWAAEPPEEDEYTGSEERSMPGPLRLRDPHRRTVIGTAAALAVVAVAATGLAVGMVNDDDDAVASHETPALPGDRSTAPTPVAAPSTVEPADLRAARAQMKRYTPPSSTTTTTTVVPETTEEQITTTARPTRHKPRPHTRRTIPNPIPGLPPIIIG